MIALRNVAHLHPLITLGLLFALVSGPTHAADDQRYQIDLLVFQRLSGGEYEESWRSDLRLTYPPQMVRLRYATDTDKEQELPREFRLHEAQDKEIAEIAAQLRRNGNYRPLFHGAWHQVLVDEKQAPSLLIQGGQRFDRHHQLGGSIKISKSRYLHLRTDLWLSSFIDAANQRWTDPWPRVPLPFEVATEDESIPAGANFPEQVEALDDGGLSAADTFAGERGFGDNPFGEGVTGEFGVDPFTQEQRSGLQETYSPLQQITDLQYQQGEYAVERTVVLRQHRRMRSSELHYIDHPMFGLIIKISRVDAVKTAAVDP